MGGLLQRFCRDCRRPGALSRVTSTSRLWTRTDSSFSQVDKIWKELPECRRRELLHRYLDAVDLLSDGLRLIGSGAPNPIQS